MIQAYVWVEVKENSHIRMWVWDYAQPDIPLRVFGLDESYGKGRSPLDQRFQHLSVWFYLKDGISITRVELINSKNLMYLSNLRMRIIFRHAVVDWDRHCVEYIEGAIEYAERQNNRWTENNQERTDDL